MGKLIMLWEGLVMVGKWTKTKLGDLCPFNYGKALTAKQRTPGSVLVVSSAGIIGTHNKPLITGKGIVIGRKGTIGSLTYVDRPFFPIDTAFYIVESDKFDLRFIYYLLHTLRLDKMNSDSAVPGLNRNAAHNLTINLPPLEEQKRIAHLLGSLDDKIELNRKMNETLEEMAQAIFKSWFVDFDGVAEEDLVESELGLTPNGWMIESLDTIATFLNGAACQKFPTKEDEEWLPVIKIKQMRAGNTSDADKATITIPKKWHIKDGDVLFSWSASLLVDIWTGGDGALNQHLFKVSSDRFPRWFYLLWSKYHLAEFQRIAAAKATTMGHIKRSHLTEAKVLIPPAEVIESQTNVLKPLLDRLVANRLQSNTLTELRDTLLPKLISGELRIPEAEEQVSELIPQENGQLELFPSNEAKQLHLFPNQWNNT